jgi:hypothetical protein
MNIYNELALPYERKYPQLGLDTSSTSEPPFLYRSELSYLEVALTRRKECLSIRFDYPVSPGYAVEPIGVFLPPTYGERTGVDDVEPLCSTATASHHQQDLHPH